MVRQARTRPGQWEGTLQRLQVGQVEMGGQKATLARGSDLTRMASLEEAVQGKPGFFRQYGGTRNWGIKV